MPTHPALVHYALEPLAVELREVPVPDVGDDDVLLAVGAVSVCGSTCIRPTTRTPGASTFPLCSATSSAEPSRTGRAVRGFREGDRVVSETAAQICGECMQCRTGWHNLCPARLGFGYGLDGAMAQHVRVPARCLHRIPDSLPFDLACLSEPHAVAYQAMCINSQIRPGDSVVVLGPGPIGLLCARMAALSGADPLIVAGLAADGPRSRLRVHSVRPYGESPGRESRRGRALRPDGADVVCDATGASQPLEDAIRIARPNGEVTKVGWSPEKLAVDMNPLVLRNVRIQGSFSHNYLVWERVIHLLDRRLTLPETIVGPPLAARRLARGVRRDARSARHQPVLLPNGR